MKQKLKERYLTVLNVIGEHINKYRLMMTIITFIMAAIALFFWIYWYFDETTLGIFNDNLYLAAYIIFFVLSFAVGILLIVGKYVKIKPLISTIIVHTYVFIIIAWSTLVCVLDLSIDSTPLLYLIIFTFLSGFIVLEPIFYTSLVGTSFLIVMLFDIARNFDFFNGTFEIETIVCMAMFVIVIAFTSFRLFNITIREYKAQKELIKLTYYDQLTDLLNERSYLEEIALISSRIEKGNMEDFAIILMDVNNLKATNDLYGHRFGCSLVVRCGHTLPTLFKSSKLYHIGGDEFLAIVLGEDFKWFESLKKEVEEALNYSLVTFEDKELVFSVAQGYSIHQKGERYQDTLQRADDAMYIHKKMLKEKYNMKGR